MIFNLISCCKDSIEELIKLRLLLQEHIRIEESNLKDEIEKKRTQGTIVNLKNFLDWQRAFLEEAKSESKQCVRNGKPLSLAFQAVLAIHKATSQPSALTGKQLFQDKNMMKSDEQEEEGNEVDTVLLRAMNELDIPEEVNEVLVGLSED